MSEYQVDYAKHNARDKAQIRADIMTQCFHCKITPANTARILFAAGYSVKADVVTKFFAGRQKWLDSKKAAA